MRNASPSFSKIQSAFLTERNRLKVIDLNTVFLIVLKLTTFYELTAHGFNHLKSNATCRIATVREYLEISGNFKKSRKMFKVSGKKSIDLKLLKIIILISFLE